ncbi:hypothetical protein B566_EDAN014725 [Ephemera danica]|nr:hypothetical protein B566_EDAN014725 [Ephemera danica]
MALCCNVIHDVLKLYVACILHTIYRHNKRFDILNYNQCHNRNISIVIDLITFKILISINTPDLCIAI